jgi:hypothetical protein
MINPIPIVELTIDGAKVEDVTQLLKDTWTLITTLREITAGKDIGTLTEAELDTIIPAISRTGIVLGDIWGVQANRPTIMQALKGV